ncbi:bifunctional proline dehydrogenase/L-glutamate gamma-semialdehyde dehydrogenase PutA [Marinibactrum halimedae]|uniref:Bifunctional protein PutA n=1 Tax=Marinibactrum halimedae TaxID=1444977 RepID=A0AA37T7V9_9GAMM|nr:bifunctional proline dehydrogenase/L-glutamate gamma-semialdehyde dehydrogenase PutA [Marinibactrum halimedae]MCD9460802.1 bifunctional proline dehydrogenase/L-glutamate gamma-semialdehyde dehydrogenase PutA [Marinibactrum halimedae]GLS27391.1 bifunctional protein PutA [Marinibactrum halimedae]
MVSSTNRTPTSHSAEHSTASLNSLYRIMADAIYLDETEAVKHLLDYPHIQPHLRQQALQLAETWTLECREDAHNKADFDDLLQEFSLETEEGLSLMCLAESLLRIPDSATADKLITERLTSVDWLDRESESASRWITASRWGLAFSGNALLESQNGQGLSHWFGQLQRKLSKPVIRVAVRKAIGIMAKHYVVAEDIDTALNKLKNHCFSFDMLGEGARSDDQAERFFHAYENAIIAVGKYGASHPNTRDHSVSIKLSALHPRYEATHPELMLKELLPKLRSLAMTAHKANVDLTLDAEEAHRLNLSLALFEGIARTPELAGWKGLGLAVQAYQKRAPYVIDWLVALAKETGNRFNVRLVKGAYWDTEIQLAQHEGQIDYPVYTRKVHSDLAYLVCADKLLANTDALFPQFASHNAHSIATISLLAKERATPHDAFEFQRLHGMGEQLFEHVAKATQMTQTVRVYAPIGSHKDLLPYLVRRLLENGANSSFVYHFLDENVPIQELIQDPWQQVQRAGGEYRHSQLATPNAMYERSSEPRKNSAGLDFSHPQTQTNLSNLLAQDPTFNRAAPMVSGQTFNTDATHLSDKHAKGVTCPANTLKSIGTVVNASPEEVDAAITAAKKAEHAWRNTSAEQRASILEDCANAIEAKRDTFMQLIVHEAGRTISDTLYEIREAVDFLRYYATLARQQFGEAQSLTSPAGESNHYRWMGRGTFACISPWNFPLAIFVGQISAALAAGNCVVAKPAEQTPLTAACAVQTMIAAGIPAEVLHLLPGAGDVGEAMVNHPHISGVAFTGSCATAKRIHQQLSARPGPILPLIAETGGLNTMLVDSSALPEQVVDDVVASAFHSAGQRCSSLRVLYLQNDTAEEIIELIKGAMARLTVGHPQYLSTDIGPVIDSIALQRLESHKNWLKNESTLLATTPISNSLPQGHYFAPMMVEIQQLNQLSEEIFGPILHVIRYNSEDLPKIIDDINNSGYGLTLGIHSRLDQFINTIVTSTHVGNTYINRNMIGATVGVNPFGGCGLSGTGPKAGSPGYLRAFGREHTRTENIAARGGNIELFNAMNRGDV